MTRKLFYEDVYRSEFESVVVESAQEDGRDYVVLEETAFYPTGGGQPHDTGSLSEIEVYNVEEVDGDVRHYVKESISEGTSVKGRIDWKRRFDHMQQHSGQHIISAVFHDTYNFPTTSFHLGADTVTIDLDTEELSDSILQEAEERVNEIIRRNVPIESKWVSVAEANEYPLRKPLSVEGDVRLVVIPDVDYSGCGGTHPHSTSELMAVKFLGWTKNKKQVRLEFVCGNRVLEKLGDKHRVLNEVKQYVSKPEEEVAGEVGELIRAGKEKDKRIAELEKVLLQYEARDVVKEAQGNQVIARAYEGRTMKELQALGKAIVEEASYCYLILVSEQDDQLQFVLASGKEQELECNMNEVAGTVMPLIEGKGGGKPNFVQGGGKKLIDAQTFIEQVEAAL
ncbi:alanyl-tRNA editing protein [Halobacillus salinus]|uniref:Alanine--tRNA ligase n=1 Tax=Halobacillus salinus TaxID=192814 RepID=A0A4Z0H220_9BACI|nr:DHHA1 domain-containing protein [Halobacillus salinus]TGB03451.1 alanyl-tRNA editing protein [Halobacillus salinus]